MQRQFLLLPFWVCLLLTVGGFAQPENGDDYFHEGVRLQKSGDLQGAVAAYEKALQIDSSRADILSNHGFASLQLGDVEGAVESFTRALHLDQSLTAVRMYLGLALFQQGRFEAAYRETARAAREAGADPRYEALQSRALHLSGLCALKTERLDAGIRTLEAVIEMDPRNLEAIYSLATAYIRADQLEEAERLLEGPLRGVEGAEVAMIRGALWGAHGDYEKARQAYEGAGEKARGPVPTLHSRLGYAQLRLEEYPEALQSFRAELQINPTDFDANAYIGWLCLRGLCPAEDVYKEAEQRLTVALDQRPEDNGLRYLMGQIYQVTGRYDAAVEMLQSVVEEEPEHKKAHVLLAKSYARLKKMEEFRKEQEIIRVLTEKEQEENMRFQREKAKENAFSGLPETSVEFPDTGP